MSLSAPWSEAYELAKNNNGAPGIDGVTFAAIEAQGVATFLEQIQDELVQRTYVPLPVRRQEIPKDGGKVRVLSIPAIRDRVVQGALKLILEPIFEADFQPGSFGYRPKRTAHEAVVDDADVLHLLKLMLKANGQRGVPQGGVISRSSSSLWLQTQHLDRQPTQSAVRRGGCSAEMTAPMARMRLTAMSA